MCQEYTQLSLSVPQTKRCAKCGETKPLTEFHRDRSHSDGYKPRCKQCLSPHDPKEYAARRARYPAGMKRCTICGEVKPLSEFGKQASQPDAHQPRCKACKKVADAEGYAAHRAERSGKQRIYNAAHREERRAYRKAEYAANREAAIAAAVEWARANPDKRYVTTERWRKSNMERTREYVRRRYARRKAGRVASFTLVQLQAKMDYWGNRCHICGAAATTIDHVKPLAKGGLDVLANLRPACTHCNSSKRDRWPYPLTRNVPIWQ